MKTGYVFLGKNVFSTLLALSEKEQEKGLMFVDPPTPVMSFVYDYPKISKFWMANTPAALDIVFCRNGKISQICYGKPYSEDIIGNNDFSDFVVELPAGTVDAIGLKIGQSAGILKK